jgi:uncharacterized membrane protein
MRTTSDRIRHALSFEILGLLLVTPLGAIVFHHPIEDIGVLALVGATIATGWNYVFNLGCGCCTPRCSRSGSRRCSCPS